MNTIKKLFKNSSGMTLIELSMVLILSGIIISILVGIVPLIFTADKVNDTRTLIKTMDTALQGYLSVNRRLPCPDTDGDGIENREDNGTAAVFSDDSCPSYKGNLPFITLGITSDKDVWNNRLTYGVYSDLTRTDTETFCTDIIAIMKITAAAGAEDPGQTDKLYVTSRSETPNPSMNMAYVLVSRGLKDMDQSGSPFDGFNASAPSFQFECEERQFDENYDDIVKAETLPSLYGKHCIGNPW